MKAICIDKYSSVYYDEKKDEYVKFFMPKFSKKVKYYLGFRKFPAYNFKYISDELNKIGIKTAEITKCSKYSISTKNIKGLSLGEYLEINKNNKEKIENITSSLIDTIYKIISNNFFFGDFSYNNFLVKNDEIYAIDLEDYRKNLIFRRTKNFTLSKMEGKLPNEVIEKVKKKLFK